MPERRVPLKLARLLLLLALPPVVMLAGCQSSAPAGPAPDGASALEGPPLTPVDVNPNESIREGLADGVPRLRPVVLGTLPHDRSSWTQGLEVSGQTLYEGTGLYGRSKLRELDPRTGRVLRDSPLPAELYGEGITVLGDQIWQLTWKNGVVLGWDRPGLRQTGRQPWSGEGWGLCHTSDGRVVASDGTDRLRLLAGSDLRPLGAVAVRIGGRAVTALNELECVGDSVYANVFETDWLVRIDLANGNVTAVVDAAGLLPEAQRVDASVLNGIAALPGTDEFLLTGKLWPTIFRVRLASQ